MVSEEELLAALQHGYDGYIKNGHLHVHDLPQYAQQLKEDLDWIKLEQFELLPLLEISQQVSGINCTVPICQYRFGETRNDVDNADPSEDKTKLLSIKNTEGTGLDREDLRWLCDIFRNARRQLPHLWRKDEELRTLLAQRHLNTVNELFWLGLWNCPKPEKTIRERKLDPVCEKTVDWSLECAEDGQKEPRNRINLEVKNLTTSLEPFLFRGHRETDDFVGKAMRGIDRKFPSTSSQDVNVMCFTTFINAQNELTNLGTKVLDDHKGVDAVMTWITTADLNKNWQICMRSGENDQNRKLKILQRHFIPPSYRQGKPLLYKHPLWGVLPGQQD